MNLEEKILKLLKRPKYSPLDARGLARHLNVRPNQMDSFQQALRSLEQTGRIARIRHDRYALPEEADLIPGRIQMQRSGSGMLHPEDPKISAVSIPAEATGTALHQDRVLIRLEAGYPAGPRERGSGLQGKVIRILERARTQVVGTLSRSRQFLYIIPDDPRIPHDIYVPPARKFKRPPRIGDKVVVELVEWPSRHTNPEGRIVEVLGKPEKSGVDIQSILRQYNLQPDFPEAVLRDCKDLPQTVRASEFKGRRDCRQQNVITIDPEDAKDFDDGFCLQQVNANQWRLWIHIADVSHYVKPGSALDKEAQRRGNSTYLVDRVVPMLPEALSNELCSLKPKVDRLSKCVEVLLNRQGKVLQSDFYPAIIHSKHRYSYPDALAVLERQPKGPLEKMLHDANRIAQRFRQARFQAGALDLDSPETKLRLDAQGRLLRVEEVENDISHQLVEEFMLLANETVAARLKAKNQPVLYRIHEAPNPERLDELRELMAVQGLKCRNLNRPGELQRLLKKIKEHPSSHALTIAVLRSLKRARYAVDPLGHFGLAKANYTHFTSPIRRYPDLLVHRALFEPGKWSRQTLKQWADHCSFTERNSDDAEQDSKTVKLLNFLEQQLRQDETKAYEGIVTEVRNFGFFVEVPDLGLSGLVRVSTLEDDFYLFDASKGRLRGRRRGRIIALGNRVKVRIVSVNQFKKQVNFTLA